MNSMGGVWLLAMVGLSGIAIATAKGWKWKLINLGIILTFISAGLGIGFAAGAWGENGAIGALIAIPLATWFGASADFSLNGVKDLLPSGQPIGHWMMVYWNFSAKLNWLLGRET